MHKEFLFYLIATIMITVSKNAIDATVMQIGCKCRFGAVFGSLKGGHCRIGAVQPQWLTCVYTHPHIL
jgi:hypothetical protein